MTDARNGAFSEYLKRDSLIVASALVIITILAWVYLVILNGGMHMSAVTRPTHISVSDVHAIGSMSGMDMQAMKGTSSNVAVGGVVTGPAPTAWTPTYFLFIFAMWAVMMVGMMTPTVSPMVLIYSQLAKTSAAQGMPFASSMWFAGGYLIAWTSFALLASLAQYALDRAALLTPMMTLQSRTVSGTLLIAAGLYQWLPMKGACLSSCRAPLAFVQRHGGFSASALGSLRLGSLHGLYCVGCCWALMLLLFVAGVMNLFWIAALMFVVLAEKVLPAAAYLSRGVGVVAIGWGIWLLGT